MRVVFGEIKVSFWVKKKKKRERDQLVFSELVNSSLSIRVHVIIFLSLEFSKV